MSKRPRKKATSDGDKYKMQINVEDSRTYSENGIKIQDVPAFVQHLLKQSEVISPSDGQITCDDSIRRLQLRRISLQKCINVLEAMMRDAEETIVKFQAIPPAIRSKMKMQAAVSSSPFSPEKN